MTQEDKELLFKDLSARLTYGVIVDYKESEYDFHHWKISTLHAPAYSQSGSLINTDSDGWIEYNEYKGCGMSTGSRPFRIGEVLPYLRPMSSMTEEEINEFHKLRFIHINYGLEPLQCVLSVNEIDWLNAHHFDYRELIDKGLALEAPTDMYNN